jgi:phosphonate transport system substrate-binding protein
MQNLLADEAAMNRQTHHTPFIFALAGFVFVLGFAAPALGQAQDGRVQRLSLGLVFEGPREPIEARFREFVDYLARKISSGQQVKGTIVLAPTALKLVKPLEDKQVDFYMESPYPTYLINRQGSALLLLRRWKGGVAEYRSILFTVKESPTRLEDLRGRIIAFEDPGSTSGYFLPKLLLMRKGFTLVEKSAIDAQLSPKEIGYIFAHSDKKIVELVLSKKVAAGAFSSDDYAALDEKEKSDIAILAETGAFPRHLVSIRKDLNAAVAKRLKEALLSMDQDKIRPAARRRAGGSTTTDGTLPLPRQKINPPARPV